MKWLVVLLAVFGLALGGVALGAEPAGHSRKAAALEPITERNWREHPSVADIRALVEANEAAIKAGGWRRAAKRCEAEERPFASERVVFRDAKGHVRKYVTVEGTDDSAYTLEHQFDERGRLRFVYGKSGATNDAVVEHRLYFAEDGRIIWRNRRETGPGYTFLDDFPDAWVVRDPEKAWSAPPACN